MYTLYIHLYFVFKYNVSFRGNTQGSNSGMFFDPAGNKTSVSLRNSMNIVYIYIYSNSLAPLAHFQKIAFN